MFKRFIILFLVLVGGNALAVENINILWGFNIGSNQAITLKQIAENANKMQSKYNFIIESKPGAGGSIAANHVLRHPNNTLVGMSSSFFIRPSVEVVGIHDLNKFKPIFVQGGGAPLAIVSSKYKNINDLLQQPNPTIGISGVGGVADILSRIIKEKNPNVVTVNYKGMLDAVVSAAGGHVDAAITFIIDATPMIESNKLSVIGYTGSKNLEKFKNLQLSNQGFKNTDKLVVNYAIFSSNDIPFEKYIEIHNILSKANNNVNVLEYYNKDLILPSNISVNQYLEWYNFEKEFWKNIANNYIKK